MGSPVLFQGTFVKFLKAKFNLFDVAYILTGTQDPRSVATDAPKGSLMLRQGTNGEVFYKLDAGTTTNWRKLLGEASGEFADELKENFRNILDNSYFDALTYNIFRIDGNGKVDIASTATYDVATDSYLFGAPAQTLISTSLLDADFLSSGKDVDEAQVVFQWGIGLVDPAATYLLSRDGGNHYQTMTMDRVSNSNDTFQGFVVFPEETTQAQQTFATTTNAVELTNVAGTNEALAQRIEFTADSTLTAVRLAHSRLGTVAGNWRVSVVQAEQTATPATLANATASTGTQVIAAGAYVGQTFTTPVNAGNYSYVNSVTIRINNSGSNTQHTPLHLTIWATSGSSPIGRPLAHSDTTIYLSDIPVGDTDYTFVFNTPIQLDPGSEYAWALQSTHTSGANPVMPTTTTDTFANGRRLVMTALASAGVTTFATEDMTNFSVNYETRTWLPGVGVIASTAWFAASTVSTSATDIVYNLSVSAPAGFYYLVYETDAAYKASYSAGVNALRLHGNTALADTRAARYDAGVWAMMVTTTFRFETTYTALTTYASMMSLTTFNASVSFTAGSVTAQAQSFVVSNNRQIRTLGFGITRSTNDVAGSLRAKIVRDAAGVPSALDDDIMWTGEYKTVNSLFLDRYDWDISGVTLTAGTYHAVLESDATYRAAYTATTSVEALQNTGGSGRSVYNGSSWSAGSGGMYATLNGRLLDLKLFVQSSVGSVAASGYGVFYDRPAGMVATGIVGVEVFNFNSLTNQTTFQISKFLPNPDLLVAYHAQTGQAWRYPAFDIQGQTIVFPDNFFGAGGQSQAQTLIFDQTRGGAYDNSDTNALLLSANHLGSTDTALDRSSPGRGPLLRRPDGVLRELFITNDDEIGILSTP